jgi:diaminopimelate decarboxylase
MFEPGRSLVGNAGVLLSEVLYLKPGRARGKNFCIVDAAMNDLMRPAMYEAWMGIAACTLRDSLRQPVMSWSARCASRATGWAATAPLPCSRRCTSPCCPPAPTA